MATIALRGARRAVNSLSAPPNALDPGLSHSPHIQLSKLTRSALPADIRRLCAREKIENVANVSLDYHRFVPTGRAYVTLTQPDFVPGGLRRLQGTIVGGVMVEAGEAEDNSFQTRPWRSRGTKGRAEAAERGVPVGNGADGAVASQGRCVVMSGLPGRLSPEALRDYLKAFKLAGKEGSRKEIVKLDVVGHERIALTSRHFVRMASVSEAHRLVRNLHMTFFRPEVYDTRYPIRARVVY